MEYNNQKIISLSGLAFDTKAIMIYPETRVYEKIKDYCEEDVKAVARICHTWTGSILPLAFDEK